jgi:Flp pilus assembly protein TadB
VSGLLAAGLGFAALLAGAGWRSVRREALRRRLGTPATAPPRSASRAPVRWSWKESRLPALVRQLGADFRRAGLRLGSVDMALLMLLGGVVAGAGVFAASEMIHWSAAAAVMGAWLPKTVVAGLAARRITLLERQLADALDGIVASLQAGVGLRQAMEIVRLNHSRPISAEFDAMLRLMDAGSPATQVFPETAILLRSAQFDLFAATMAAKWDAGGNITPMLGSLARRIRDSVRLRRRVLSLTAEARFGAVVLFITPWALAGLMWWRVPENLVFLYRNELGRAFIEICIALQFVGIAWMSRLLRRENV